LNYQTRKGGGRARRLPGVRTWPADQTFGQWFKGQWKGAQIEVLGLARQKLFENGMAIVSHLILPQSAMLSA
jgi:hypothetical protein